MMVLEILELFGSLERAVAHRCNDLNVGSESAQRDFEAHLIVARRRAAVRDALGFQRQGHLRDGLRLQHAFRAHAQRIEAAAAYVAHDEKPQHLVEIRGARVNQMMRHGAQLGGALGQGTRRGGIDASGIDRDGNHRPPVGVLEPGHAERGVESAGKSQKYGQGVLP